MILKNFNQCKESLINLLFGNHPESYDSKPKDEFIKTNLFHLLVGRYGNDIGGNRYQIADAYEEWLHMEEESLTGEKYSKAESHNLED